MASETVTVYLADKPRCTVRVAPTLRVDSLFLRGFYSDNCSVPIVKIKASGSAGSMPRNHVAYAVRDLSDGSAVNNPATSAPFQVVSTNSSGTRLSTYPDYGTNTVVIAPGGLTGQERYVELQHPLLFLGGLNNNELNELNLEVTGLFDEAVTFDLLVLDLFGRATPSSFSNPYARGPASVMADVYNAKF
jgi:hypothetical protein